MPNMEDYSKFKLASTAVQAPLVCEPKNRPVMSVYYFEFDLVSS